MNRIARYHIVILGSLFCGLGTRESRADSIFESFEGGLGAWTSHGYLYCQVPPNCPPLEFTVTPTGQYAQHGARSLEFWANGLNDDGTVWIQRQIQLPPGTWNIQLQFYVFDEYDGEVGAWDVVAYVGLAPPAREEDFTLVGRTGHAGWTAYQHSRVLSVTQPTIAYVALGYNIVFETYQTNWFDSV